jgi:hypothetical protein
MSKPQINVADAPLLVSRSAARKMLGGPSIQHMLKLEELGALTVVRLNPRSSLGRVYYRREQIEALANGAATMGENEKEFKKQRAERTRRRKATREARAGQ